MSKIIHNIKEKLARRKSSEPHAPTAKSTASNSQTNTKNGPSTSKAKESSSSSNDNAYSIQPHPATTNDPADLQAPGSGGLKNGGPMDAFHAREPYVPSEQIRNNLPEPLSHDELQVRQAALASEAPGYSQQ